MTMDQRIQQTQLEMDWFGAAMMRAQELENGGFRGGQRFSHAFEAAVVAHNKGGLSAVRAELAKPEFDATFVQIIIGTAPQTQIAEVLSADR